MKARFLSAGLLVVALIAWFAAPTHGQIFESICRDANCTDIALGPLALIPQCYRTPQGSVRLNINESDPDVLDLCFYLSEDCNETSVDTCHMFVNGEPCDCPFFRGLSDSLSVVFEWDPATIELLIDIIDMQLFNNFFGLTEFGNWCGPGHGGTNDCCDDEVCSACNDTIGLTMDCLDQCPAEDDLDFACAVHDFCYGANDYEELFPDEDFECSSLFGIQKSGYCECDCQLVETARDIDSNDFYRSALIFTFTHITNCWYNSTSGPVCNTKGDDRILVTEFC
ncbi:uncharacterized protein ACA1_378150 [Acanthamoeba castellanii str. Neff]|uniref:Uncharacterized protein n=1 Tax=Acanthamoeba castellanii (strain ATCC 30010 / Neff) TaxID=1257118 RepID=L8GS06_ACACF|nr:uncharacterized protein ACA1_378150 [Acanthamoeba castellanii str. Neff]ELR15697.1 hypothetical protein ACA1_378150 [Acanthamoeba castellanii str. Neff]